MIAYTRPYSYKNNWEEVTVGEDYFDDYLDDAVHYNCISCCFNECGLECGTHYCPVSKEEMERIMKRVTNKTE